MLFSVRHVDIVLFFSFSKPSKCSDSDLVNDDSIADQKHEEEEEEEELVFAFCAYVNFVFFKDQGRFSS